MQQRIQLCKTMQQRMQIYRAVRIPDNFTQYRRQYNGDCQAMQLNFNALKY